MGRRTRRGGPGSGSSPSALDERHAEEGAPAARGRVLPARLPGQGQVGPSSKITSTKKLLSLAVVGMLPVGWP